MCNPKFCAIQITEDVRVYAVKRELVPEIALTAGTEEKPTEIREAGVRVYQET